jgi:hypothetical protein
MTPPAPPELASIAHSAQPSRQRVMRAMLRGSLGFAGVSLTGFSVWAVAGKWFYAHLGEAGLYGACLLVFLGVSGLLLPPLVVASPRLVRFYLVFIPAFLAYAVVWSGAWFTLHFGLGEWLGSLLGSIAFAAVVGWGFRNFRGFVAACAVLFCFHSAGYFLGGRLMYWLASPDAAHALPAFSKAQLSILAKLAWGLLYGLGFGAGIGFAFCTAQEKRN